MRFLFIAFLVTFCFACSMEQETVPCKSGHGYLYKDGKEFVCPFSVLEHAWGTVSEWDSTHVKNITVIPADYNDYYPVNYFYTSAYNISLKVPKKSFMEERYKVQLQILDYETNNLCGEPKEAIFYKIAEDENFIKYYSYTVEQEKAYGTKFFFAQREMPSYEISCSSEEVPCDKKYHVLKTCGDNSFYIKGEVL